MTSRFINGANFAISTAMAAAVPITAITNASPAIASAGVLPAAGDILMLASGWPDLTDTVARAAAPAAGDFTLEGTDTTNVVDFPAGEGIGAYRIASAFVPLSQTTAVEMSGGEQQYFNWQYVEDKSNRQRQRGTFKNARTVTHTMDYDPNLPWYAALVAADRKGEPVVLRERLPGGEVLYYLVYVAFNKIPTKAVNTNMQVTVAFSLLSDPIRYAA